MASLTCLDLFCGCGGASLGYHAAGFQTVAALDSSEVAVEAFDVFLPGGVARVADITETRADQLPVDLSLIHASPPCTDFSSAGPRVEGPSAELSVIATGLICSLAPRVFVVENVPRFLASQAYVRCREMAEAAGYDSVAFELDASLYGVPQTRRRVFWVGARNAAARLEAVAREVHAAASARPAAVADTVAGAPDFFFLMPRGALNRAIHSSALPAPTLRTNCANAMPAGYVRRLVDAAEPSAAAELDLRQLAAMQALPSAPLAASRTVAARLIGNVLPPPLATVIGNALRKHGLFDLVDGPRAARGSPVRFVPSGRGSAVGDTRQMLSRRGSLRKDHISLFSHAHFAEAPDAATEEDDDSETEETTEGDVAVAATPGEDRAECAALTLGRRRDTRWLVMASGRCETCDAVAAAISSVPLPPGWRLEIRQRAHTAFRQDDLYWSPPAQVPPRPSRRPIRSRAALLIELCRKPP
jgi:DNA (cytosine-5)-methyltransferase 1